VVLGADTSNVDLVFVAGMAVKRHGRLLRTGVERVRRLALASHDYLLQQSGLLRPAATPAGAG
jgi:hypothetical protein